MPKREAGFPKILQKLSGHIGLIVAIITGLGTIGGAGVAACHWVVDTVSAQSNQRIDQLQIEMERSNREQEQAIVRLELQNLIKNNPENVIEIEILAKKYFVELQGDLYMTTLYSNYAREYGADTSFVVYH